MNEIYSPKEIYLDKFLDTITIDAINFSEYCLQSHLFKYPDDFKNYQMILNQCIQAINTLVTRFAFQPRDLITMSVIIHRYYLQKKPEDQKILPQTVILIIAHIFIEFYTDEFILKEDWEKMSKLGNGWFDVYVTNLCKCIDYKVSVDVIEVTSMYHLLSNKETTRYLLWDHIPKLI